MEQVSVFIYIDGIEDGAIQIPMTFNEAMKFVDEVENTTSTIFVTAYGLDGSQLTFVPRRVGAIWIVKGEEA